LSDARLEPLLPRFVRTCRNLSQFWEFIKHKFGTYHERRVYLWEEFQPRLGDSHGKGRSPVKPAPRHAELAVNLAGAMALSGGNVASSDRARSLIRGLSYRSPSPAWSSKSSTRRT